MGRLALFGYFIIALPHNIFLYKNKIEAIAYFSFSRRLKSAPIKPENNRYGLLGRDLNPGCACNATNHGGDLSLTFMEL